MTFADKLSQWRAAKRWSRAAAVAHLSAAIGVRVPVRTYEDWEAGRRTPHEIIQKEILECLQ